MDTYTYENNYTFNNNNNNNINKLNHIFELFIKRFLLLYS